MLFCSCHVMSCRLSVMLAGLSSPEVDLGVASRNAHDVGAAHLAVALQNAFLLHSIVGRDLAKSGLDMLCVGSGSDGETESSRRASIRSLICETCVAHHGLPRVAAEQPYENRFATATEAATGRTRPCGRELVLICQGLALRSDDGSVLC